MRQNWRQQAWQKSWDKRKGDCMIKIVFRNGCVVKWKKKEWTDYKYDGRCFIVIKNERWVGIYNMDSIISVVIH